MVKKYRYVVLNDISEHAAHEPIIRKFLDKSPWIWGRGKGFINKTPLIVSRKQETEAANYRLVGAGEVREKVLRHLEGETKKSGKYGLILLLSRGGPIVFSDRRLLDVGERVKILPYSSHEKRQVWPSVLDSEVRRLGENARVLLLEGDIGQMQRSAKRIRHVRRRIMKLRNDALVNVVAGVTNEAAAQIAGVDFAGYRAPARILRLSETVETMLKSPNVKDMLKMDEYRRMYELRRKRSMTGTLPY